MHETTLVLDSYRGDASEDRAEIIETGETGAVVLVVADGVGGREGGGAAAEMAVRLVKEAVGEADARRLADPRPWHGLIAQIDRELFGDPESGETTLVTVCVTPRRIVGVSVGDSEAWLVTPGGHFDLTGAQERKPYLGSGAARPIPFALNVPLRGGRGAASASAALLLIATDGLFKYAPPERIRDTVAAAAAAAEPGTSLDEIAGRLVNLARSPSGGNLYDDIAVLLCRLRGSSTSSGGGNDASFGGETFAARLRRSLLPRRGSGGGAN